MKKQKPNPPRGENPMRSVPFQIPRRLILGIVAIVVLIILASFIRSFWYFEVINNDEVGITIEAGQIQQ
jgi:hypothetical protein